MLILDPEEPPSADDIVFYDMTDYIVNTLNPWFDYAMDKGSC